MKFEGLTEVALDDQLVAPALSAWSENRPYHRQAGPGEFGGSTLGKCAQALAFEMAGVPKTDPMGEGGHFATGTGSMTHDAIQEELQARPPAGLSVAVEVPWRVDTGDVQVASAADIVFGPEGKEPVEDPNEVVDIKRIAPFGFKMKMTKEGPDRGNVLQVAMAMKALGAPLGRLVYIGQAELKGSDRIDKSDEPAFDARQNRYGEFTFSWDSVEALVDEELARLAAIKRFHGEGKEIPRAIPGVMPKGARVVDPATGAWQLWTDGGQGPALMDTGKVWQCRYCDWQTACTEQVVALAAKNAGGES